MAAVLAAAKGGYFLLDLLALLIPARRLGSRRRHAALAAAVLALTAAGAVNSVLVARGFFAHFQHDALVEPYLQARGIVAQPLRFLGLVLADYARHLPRYALGFVGHFGWVDTPLPVAVLIAYALLLLLLAATGGDPAIELPPRGRLLVAAVVAAGLLFVSASQYLGWTPVGAAAIQGPQGRYYLPLAPAAALLLYNRRLAVALAPAAARAAWLGTALAAASACFTAISLLSIWLRYYG